jgi:hypothetical protein
MPFVPLGRSHAQLSARQQTVTYSRSRHCHTVPEHQGCTAGTGSPKGSSSPVKTWLWPTHPKTPHPPSRDASKTGIQARWQRTREKGCQLSRMHTSHKNGAKQGPSQRDLAKEQVNKQRRARCIAPAAKASQAVKTWPGALASTKTRCSASFAPHVL